MASDVIRLHVLQDIIQRTTMACTPCVECEHNGRLKVLHLVYRMDNHLVYWKGKTGDT